MTDDFGLARMAMDDAQLPDDLKGGPLMQPGLYHVEITHSDVAVPARYQAGGELGFEVDPSQRGGTAGRFELKAK